MVAGKKGGSVSDKAGQVEADAQLGLDALGFAEGRMRTDPTTQRVLGLPSGWRDGLAPATEDGLVRGMLEVLNPLVLTESVRACAERVMIASIDRESGIPRVGPIAALDVATQLMVVAYSDPRMSELFFMHATRLRLSNPFDLLCKVFDSAPEE